MSGEPLTTPHDRLAQALRELARMFVESFPTAPVRTPIVRCVNGRGQLLESPGTPVADPTDAIGTLLWAPEYAHQRDLVLAALRDEPKVVKNVHHCIHDGGAAYIQALDLDRAAVCSYLIGPLLALFARLRPRKPFDATEWDPLVSPVLEALRADAVDRTLTTPILGVQVAQSLQLANDAVLRAATEEELAGWSEDESLEPSLVRDLLTAEAVVEVRFRSAWGGPRVGEGSGPNVGTFDAEGVDLALEASGSAIGLLRVATGRELPLVFTEERIVAIPWARNRLFHRPTLSDTTRRFERSPTWVFVVEAKPLERDEARTVVALSQAIALAERREPEVTRAMRLFLLERDFVNLYRIFDVVQSRAGRRMRSWATQADMNRFTQTANSADAIGDAWARHGRRYAAPDQPMSRGEADDLVRRVLIGWIEEEAAAQGRNDPAGGP